MFANLENTTEESAKGTEDEETESDSRHDAGGERPSPPLPSKILLIL
jgi:hypothetical protein